MEMDDVTSETKQRWRTVPRLVIVHMGIVNINNIRDMKRSGWDIVNNQFLSFYYHEGVHEVQCT